MSEFTTFLDVIDGLGILAKYIDKDHQVLAIEDGELYLASFAAADRSLILPDEARALEGMGWFYNEDEMRWSLDF